MNNSQAKQVLKCIEDILNKNPKWVPLSEREDFSQTLMVNFLKAEKRGTWWDPDRGASLSTFVYLAAQRLSWKWAEKEYKRKLAYAEHGLGPCYKQYGLGNHGDTLPSEEDPYSGFYARWESLGPLGQERLQEDILCVACKKNDRCNKIVKAAASRLEQWHAEGGSDYPVKEGPAL